MSKRKKPTSESSPESSPNPEIGPEEAAKAESSCCEGLGDLLQPEFFKALGDPNRIALLARLSTCREPCCVSEISCCCPVDLSVVSRHLAILRGAGIVESQKRGKEVYYTVRYDKIVNTLRRIADAIDECACSCKPEDKEPENG